MYHNNDNNEQYGNNQGVPPTPSGVYGTPAACGGLYEGAAGFRQVASLQTAEESDEESSSSSTSSSTSGSSSSSSTEPLLPPQPCAVCLQSRCVCNESNGFDPAILQLQLPQIALLMQQGNHMTSSPLPSPSSSSSTSFSPPSSPKPSSDFLSQPPPFVCQLCQEWFVVHEKLILHLVVNHSMVYCKFCTRLFRSQSEHTICVAHQGTLPCQVCQAHFRTNSSTTCHDLAQHQSRAHDMHTCPFCGLAVRPREPFLSHLRKKHHCRDRLLLEKTMHSSGIVSEVSDTWSFLCKLCKKEYRKPELFGHFHTYHHLTLPCLIELLHCGRIFIPVSGYPASIANTSTTSTTNISTTNLPSSSSNNSGIMYNHHIHNHHQQQQLNFNHSNISSSCCTVCSKPFTVQVPKIAHDVFCAGMAYCQYCTLSFSSGLARELHVVREHSSLPCVSCGESFPAETSLTAHYARTHGAVLCCCCDTLVPVNPGGLEDHLATRHYCNVPANMTTLCQVGALLACNLCMTANKFTSVADDLPSIFIHLCQGHCMTPNKALNLLCRPSTHGGLSVGPPEEKTVKNEAPIKSPEVPQITPQFEAPTSDWNNHDNLKEEDEDATDSILVPQVNLNASSDNESSADEAPTSEGEPSDEEEEESPARRRSTEADVDPEDMDCVSDSSDDEGLPLPSLEKLACEMCTEKSFASPRDLCAHLFSIHKLHWDRKSLTDSDAQYHCESCAHKAPDRQALARHRAQVHRGVPGRGGKCRFCPQLFQLAEARNQHQLQMHADQQRAFYRCPVCQLLASSTVVLSRHLLLAHPTEPAGCGVRLKCRVCMLLFPSLAGLRLHFRSAHPAAMVFRCRHCSAHLKTRKTLRHHVKVVHSEARKRDCGACGKVLWSKRAYAIHFRMKHSKTSKVGFRCRICQQRFDTKEQRKLHYTLDHEGESPYHCVDCGKGFASKSGMYGHRQLHTGSGISKCEYCGKEFTRKDSYNEHLLIHNGPRHKCPHCPKEFVQRSNLVRHIRIHTGEKPYQCTFCEKRFSDKGACNSHIRVHTREETCSCPYCGQTFSKKQKLKYHIRKHTGEGLIECEICNKMFTNSFALKEHRVIHNRQTQVVCPQCGKGFNSEKYLQRHVAIVHEPSNAFSCPICSKTFSQQARLKAHVMTHSGVKHMKCLLCDKAYSVRKSLRRHLLEKHEVSPEHPQYKHCFHAMSPEEAGLGLAVAARGRRSSPRGSTSSPSKPSSETLPSSTGRKRRRVEQIVQSLQNSLQADLATPSSSRRSPSPTLARINPLVINLPKAGSRKKMTVRARSKAELRKRRRRSSSSEEEEEDSEGLNLTVVKPEDSEEAGASSDS